MRRAALAVFRGAPAPLNGLLSPSVRRATIDPASAAEHEPELHFHPPAGAAELDPVQQRPHEENSAAALLQKVLLLQRVGHLVRLKSPPLVSHRKQQAVFLRLA